MKRKERVHVLFVIRFCIDFECSCPCSCRVGGGTAQLEHSTQIADARIFFGRGNQQLVSHGVRDASAIFQNTPKPVPPTHMLKDAAKAARGAGGDSKDMAAMDAAMNYRKAHGEGKMTYAKGRMPARKTVIPRAAKGYGNGMATVAGMGEPALAKQLSDENESRTISILPSHVVEPKHTMSQAQIAASEVSSNASEADAMLPEHNNEAVQKSQEQIGASEIKYNSAHASAVMPQSEQRVVQGLRLKSSQASQAKSEEDTYAKRADAIVPEHTSEMKPKEGARKTFAQIRKQEERYNFEHASNVVTEHTQEKARRTQSQIRAAEEKANVQHANAVVPERTVTPTQRLSVAQQAANEEQEMEASASSVVATDDDIDKDMNDARTKETARTRAFHQDVAHQRSLNRLAWKAHDETNTERQMQSQIETKMERHMQSQISDIEGNFHSKLTTEQMKEKKVELQNNKHLESQVDDITAAAGPRDASHLMASGGHHTDMARNTAAIKNADNHLASQVADITSGIPQPQPVAMKSAKPVLASKRLPKAAVPKVVRKAAAKAAPKSIKKQTAKMMTGEHKLQATREKALFDAYTKSSTPTKSALASKSNSWAAQVNLDIKILCRSHCILILFACKCS